MTSPWSSFLRWFSGAFVALLVLATALIVFVNPYGNLPISGGLPHVIMDQHQRYHYPSIARSGDYDSGIFGTSSGRLLDPSQLSKLLGGRFANFAMNNAAAWEQVQLAKVYLDAKPAPHAVLFAMDWVWCDSAADQEETKRAAEFPRWLYDNATWNDWLYLLNANALRGSLDRIGNLDGHNAPAIRSDGYGVFVPPEAEYDAAKARGYIWRGRKPFIPPMTADHRPTSMELSAWRFPALFWLDELLGRLPPDTLRVLAFMPPHVANHAVPGSREAARIKLCKAKVMEIAKAHGAHYLDFWIRSPISLQDVNYWDRLHYRVPIASRIVDDIGLAVTGRRTKSDDFIYRGN